MVYYLVKWMSLPYEDATWELKEDVDETKVGDFRKIEGRQACVKKTVSAPIYRCWHSPPQGFCCSRTLDLISALIYRSSAFCWDKDW